MENFWQQAKQQRGFILGLSPMDGVTDYPFRLMTKKYGQPDVIFTEFANVEGLCHGASKILRHFDFDQNQQPLVAQIFGKDPKSFYQVAILLSELGVSGIDINMGCPAKTVSTHGSGAGLILTPKLAQEIIEAVRRGISDWQNGAGPEACPDLTEEIWTRARQRQAAFQRPAAKREQRPTLSVKTRIGYRGNEIQDWLPYLLSLQLDALSLHGRSLKQAYTGEADWAVIAEAVRLKNQLSPKTFLLGNGDIHTYEEAQARVKETMVDGVLIGRASMGNPYVFLPDRERQRAEQQASLLQLALEHAKVYESTYGQELDYSFLPMRKHLACYTKGIINAKKLRLHLITSKSAAEVAKVLTEEANEERSEISC
jgi:tRNA-dihydrouridine synthase